MNSTNFGPFGAPEGTVCFYVAGDVTGFRSEPLAAVRVRVSTQEEPHSTNLDFSERRHRCLNVYQSIGVLVALGPQKPDVALHDSSSWRKVSADILHGGGVIRHDLGTQVLGLGVCCGASHTTHCHVVWLHIPGK